MASISDHIRRDSEHAARMEIMLVLSQYRRRLEEDAKAFITRALAEAEGEVNGLDIGREAALSALGNYLTPGLPEPAIELESGADAEDGQGS